MCKWVTTLYSRNWHNTVNQLYFKKILFWLFRATSAAYASPQAKGHIGAVAADLC